MHKTSQRLLCAIAVLICLLTGWGALGVRALCIDLRKAQANDLVQLFGENLRLQYTGALNDAEILAHTAGEMWREGSHDWFPQVATRVLVRDEVRYLYLIDGDEVVSALPAHPFGVLEGMQLRDFSYAYTMAKITRALVVEGPLITPGTGDEVFLFLQPILHPDGAYLGQIAVALDKAYILEQLRLDLLTAHGYDYQLWRVNSQNGHKEIVAQAGAGTDFSHAMRTTLYLPTQWVLSIQPEEGWMPGRITRALVVSGILLDILLIALAYSVCHTLRQRRQRRDQALRDPVTGLYTFQGFTQALEGWFAQAGTPVSLFYFALEEYNHVAQQIGRQEECLFLRDVPARIDACVQMPHIAGRTGESNFVLAVRAELSDLQMADLARGLSLALLWKVRLGGKKLFLNVQNTYARCVVKAGTAGAQLNCLIAGYYDRLRRESPVRALTEKCRQLVEGKSNVAFDEYTDVEMLELSKTFNQYRKKVEQLAYHDPVFHVGNRTKYFRDVRTLIAYDKQREFTLFCVDICAFSKYNELFSANTCDLALHEVVSRLSRQFGDYLYRINGDVFLGLSFAKGSVEAGIEGLRARLTAPVTAGNATLALRVRIATCQYPRHADTPETLFDRIQSIMRYAKETRQESAVFDDRMEALLHTQARILQLLREGLHQDTVEVWFQPMLDTQTGRFTAAEALLRLPDGKGGFFPAGQVIAIAERNSMMEQVGEYVLRKACAFMGAQGLALGLKRMGVNVSVQQLLSESGLNSLLAQVKDAGVSPQAVTLEITESILIQSIDKAADMLAQLRETGIRIALDDFGVGYSSLNYLSSLPVDTLKIDRSLTREVMHSRKQYALLRAIVEMAAINGIAVVAEGVETEQENARITQSGVDFIQGYYYAKPMDGDTLAAFLRAHAAE